MARSIVTIVVLNQVVNYTREQRKCLIQCNNFLRDSERTHEKEKDDTT